MVTRQKSEVPYQRRHISLRPVAHGIKLLKPVPHDPMRSILAYTDQSCSCMKTVHLKAMVCWDTSQTFIAEQTYSVLKGSWISSKLCTSQYKYRLRKKLWGLSELIRHYYRLRHFPSKPNYSGTVLWLWWLGHVLLFSTNTWTPSKQYRVLLEQRLRNNLWHNCTTLVVIH